MAKNTLYDKVWDAHVVTRLPTGQYQLFIGLHLVHEVTTPQACDMLRERGDYWAEQPFEAMMRNAPARSGLDRAQYADLNFWMPGDILTKMDRTSMAVALEAREPLLDHSGQGVPRIVLHQVHVGVGLAA